MNKPHYEISQEFSAACSILEVDPVTVLKRMGLSARFVEDQALSLTDRQLTQVFQEIIIEYGRDDFHIRLAEGFAQGAFGNAFLALQCSDTLGAGIHRVALFKKMIEPVEWIIEEIDDQFSIELRQITSDYPLVGISQVMSFLWLVKSCRNVTAEPISPTQVMITDPVPYQSEISADFGCPIEISDKARIVFPAPLMNTAVLSANRHVIQVLEAESAIELPLSDIQDDFIETVRTTVLRLLPSGGVTLERVANKLAVSKRTLERRLHERDTRFAVVLRDCRQDMARRYLRDNATSIGEVSLLLGYREISSFYRAFKEWFNCTPQEARDGRCWRTEMDPISRQPLKCFEPVNHATSHQRQAE